MWCDVIWIVGLPLCIDHTHIQHHNENPPPPPPIPEFHTQYRPWMNETAAVLKASDAVVLNFGLHYLMEDRRLFEEEMRALLEVRG